MPANKFRAEYRCELVESLDSIVSPEQWANCKDDGDLSSHRSNIVACLDVSSDLMHSTLCVAAQLPDGRIRIEVAGAWDSTSDMRAQLQDLLARIKPVKFGWFSGSPSSAVAVELRGIRGAKEIPPKATVEACLGLVEQVNASRILHNGDPLLATHILSAKKLPSVDGWRFQRKDAGQVDAAYACAGAILLARSLKPRQPFVFLTAPAEVSGGGTHG